MFSAIDEDHSMDPSSFIVSCIGMMALVQFFSLHIIKFPFKELTILPSVSRAVRVDSYLLFVSLF